MLNSVILFALRNRPFVLVAAFVLLVGACVGHTFLFVVGLNVLYAYPLPHQVLKVTRKVDMLLVLRSLAAAGVAGSARTPGRRTLSRTNPAYTRWHELRRTTGGRDGALHARRRGPRGDGGPGVCGNRAPVAARAARR